MCSFSVLPVSRCHSHCHFEVVRKFNFYFDCFISFAWTQRPFKYQNDFSPTLSFSHSLAFTFEHFLHKFSLLLALSTFIHGVLLHTSDSTSIGFILRIDFHSSCLVTKLVWILQFIEKYLSCSFSHFLLPILFYSSSSSSSSSSAACYWTFVCTPNTYTSIYSKAAIALALLSIRFSFFVLLPRLCLYLVYRVDWNFNCIGLSSHVQFV